MSVDKFGRFSSQSASVGVRGPPGIGFLLTQTGDFNLQSKRLTNLSEPIDIYDATTKKYVDREIKQHLASINVQLNILETYIISCIKKVEEKIDVVVIEVNNNKKKQLQHHRQ